MNVRRLWATTKLDLAHNLRRPLFWIWLLILALVAWGFSGGNVRISSGDSAVGGVKSWTVGIEDSHVPILGSWLGDLWSAPGCSSR